MRITTSEQIGDPARSASRLAPRGREADGPLMLADTMMPEAFEQGGKLVGVFTTLGFALAYLVTSLE